MTFTGGTLSSSNSYSFYANSVKNAPNTAPSTAFTNVAVYASTGYEIASYSGSVLITTTTPATVVTYALS